MEIYKVNWCNYSITVLFTGAKYIFYSEYAGVVAVAERKYEESSFDENIETFDLKVGNSRLIGGHLTNDRLSRNCRTLIKKIDQRYIKKQFKFYVSAVDLSNAYIKADVITK